jgi:hypothetical protein
MSGRSDHADWRRPAQHRLKPRGQQSLHRGAEAIRRTRNEDGDGVPSASGASVGMT